MFSPNKSFHFLKFVCLCELCLFFNINYQGIHVDTEHHIYFSQLLFVHQLNKKAINKLTHESKIRPAGSLTLDFKCSFSSNCSGVSCENISVWGFKKK